MNKQNLLVAAVMAAVTVQAPGVGAQDIVNVPTGDRVLEPSVTEVFSVGSMAGEEWETFADVRTVAFDAAGNLYVLDAGNHSVVVVDPSGDLLRQFGKEGDGPGELRFPLGMVVSPEGTVAVMDMGHQAFVIYDEDGNYVRNARNNFENGLMDGAAQYHPRNGAVGVRSSFSMGPGSDAPVGAPVRFVPFAEGADVEDLATAWRPPVEASGGGERSFSGGGGGGIRIGGMPKLRAFSPIVRAAVLPDGRVAVADSSTYALKLVDATGGIGAVLKRGVAPRPVTTRDQEAEIDRREKELEEQEESGGGGGNAMMIVSGSGGGGGGGGGGAQTMQIGGDQIRDMQRARLESMVFAEEIPVITNMAADKEGRIWVERTGDRIGEDGPTDIVTVDGRYLGSIPAEGLRIPTAFGPNGLVAYVESDEFDVEYVVVKQLGGIGRE